MALEFLSCRYSLKYFVPYCALGRAKQSYRGPSKNARAQVPALFPEQAGRGFLPLGSLPRLLAFQDWDTSACLPWNGNPLFFLLWKNPKQKHQQGEHHLIKGKENASLFVPWLMILLMDGRWCGENFLTCLDWTQRFQKGIFFALKSNSNDQVWCKLSVVVLVWFLCELWWCSIYRGE